MSSPTPSRVSSSPFVNSTVIAVLAIWLGIVVSALIDVGDKLSG